MITPHLANVSAPDGYDMEEQIDGVQDQPLCFGSEPRDAKVHQSAPRLSIEQASVAFRQQLNPPPFRWVTANHEREPANHIADWVFLNTGDRVLVHNAKDMARVGTVDDVADDASLVWVWLDGIGRLLVMETDGVTFSRLDTGHGA